MEQPITRAKFKVQSYETQLQHTNEGERECRNVRLTAVYGDSEENKRFFQFTPNGTIQIGLLREETWKQFELGKEYYVDFTPADGTGLVQRGSPEHAKAIARHLVP